MIMFRLFTLRLCLANKRIAIALVSLENHFLQSGSPVLTADLSLQILVIYISVWSFWNASQILIPAISVTMIESKIIQTICFPSRFRRDGLTIVEQNNRYYCEPRKSCSPVRVPSPVSRPVTKMFVIYIKCLVFLECQSNFDSSYTGFDGKIKNKLEKMFHNARFN